MKHRGPRKSTPRVTQGEVRKKNDWKLSPDYFDAPDRRTVLVDRQRPGKGFKHVVTRTDIYRFIELLPDWTELAVGLNAIVLSAGCGCCYGRYYHAGVVYLCAWEEKLWVETTRKYYERDLLQLERLEVEVEQTGEDKFILKFDESSARVFQLLGTLLHELGHHHDRMTTRRQARTGRGEPYAEEYARRYESVIWDAYVRAFDR